MLRKVPNSQHLILNFKRSNPGPKSRLMPYPSGFLDVSSVVNREPVHFCGRLRASQWSASDRVSKALEPVELKRLLHLSTGSVPMKKRRSCGQGLEQCLLLKLASSISQDYPQNPIQVNRGGGHASQKDSSRHVGGRARSRACASL